MPVPHDPVMTFCFQCGTALAPEDRFCGNCGIALPAGGAAQAAGENVSGENPSGGIQNPSGGVSSVGSAPLEAGDEPEGRAEESQAAAASAGASAGGGAQQQAPTIIGMPADTSEPFGDAQASGEVSAPFDPATIVETPPARETPRELAQPAPEPTPGATGDASRPEPPAPAAESTPDEARASGGVAARDEGRGETGDGGGVEGSGGGGGRPSRSSGSRWDATGGRRAANKPLEAGTLLNNRYEIARKIGGGGMGAVYYAKDRNLGDAPRAVKEMIQSQLDESQHEKAISDFKRESMLLAALEHSSIPTIYDYFYDEALSRFYLVMKYIGGGDFLTRLKNAPGGRIDELTVADWGMQVADVLHYLHSQRPPIIYRDLKPANLMIDGNNGRVMLIDFGIARWVQKEEKGVTAVGTMGYAPPELFSGKAEPRTDIYSLGATMFHLLTGSDPQDNPLLIFDFTKNARPRQINPAVSNEMERILMRAVEHQPEARFRSAAELRDTLAQHMERLRAGAVTYGASPHASERQDAKTLSVDMVYCGFCGGRIAADDVFCAHCGARQPLAEASAPLRQARSTARLVVMGTTELDAAFHLQKESNLVGRTDPQSNIFPDVDLSKFDPETKISRRHARIWRHGDTFLVEDLGSVNGTVVNDAIRLGPRQPRTLENGDKLRLGETTLHFLLG